MSISARFTVPFQSDETDSQPQHAAKLSIDDPGRPQATFKLVRHIEEAMDPRPCAAMGLAHKFGVDDGNNQSLIVVNLRFV